MSISTRYNPETTESKWYNYWLDKKYFESKPDEREPFTIVIPPPNVTGVLHMGHMLNNTIQDILIRKARLDGKNACWVPGTDHASIATEAKVVQKLREKGIKKSDISRDQFLKYAFEWKENYGGIILDQLKKLGASCDWSRTRFTMEDSLYRAVIHVFVDLFKKGKIYRGHRITHWDPEAKTVLSNEEVIYRDESSRLFHLRYFLENDPNNYIVIATQRPETIMADAAVAVHPEDERYQSFIGKKVLIPLIQKPIPVIADPYVDRDFGTGALKITPAHDMNDYEIGIKHQLPVLDILTDDGKINEHGVILVGEDRFVARKKIKKLLEDSGNLEKIIDYVTSIGHSERTDAVVEPRLTLQWFLKMDGFAKTALEAVQSGEVQFFPPQMWNMYHSWLREENVRDWCISRQLWWGQRIPAWYLQQEPFGQETHIFVADNEEEALKKAREVTGDSNLSSIDLRQDEDVVDTWFSSWLWPISVFDGFENQEELKYYYPTNVLVTGWDIMFFWVARMIMSGYEWSGDLLGKSDPPFREVYFTGMVRDNKRRKMSKSIGNSPDALNLIEKYGADGVRFGMLSSTMAGNDIVFDAPFDPKTGMVLDESKLCEQGRNFCNKMWNAFRLIQGWEQIEKEINTTEQLAIDWMDEKIKQTGSEVQKYFDEYRLSDALMTLYKCIWDDFCSWYLEMIKPDYGQPISKAIKTATDGYFRRLMTMLHPFMPFITEEIWQQLKVDKNGEDCVVSQYPKALSFNDALLNQFDVIQDIIVKIREIRNNNQLGIKSNAKLQGSNEKLLANPAVCGILKKMGNLSEITLAKDEPKDFSIAFLSGTDKYFLLVEKEINKEEEIQRIQAEIEYYEGFLKSVNTKLSNDKFVHNAPKNVVELELKKKEDGVTKLTLLKNALDKLLIAVIFFFYSCTSEPASPPAPDYTDQVVGTWEMIELSVKVNQDSVTNFSVRENDWVTILQVKPAQTTFLRDFTFKREFRSLSNELIDEEGGQYALKMDTLLLISFEDTTAYKIHLSKGQMLWSGFVDWDDDGSRDDFYVGRLRKISSN
jgi:valyl-tRNA synthetase